MAEHTVKAFDEDITRLRGLIAEMGGLAEVAIAESLDALVRGDEALAEQVVARDKRIDALEIEVDKLAVRIIALRAPMADDLPAVDAPRLQAAMARLPARQRMALAMWAYADADVADIARSMELERNAAHQLLHRAKAALRQQLQEHTP